MTATSPQPPKPRRRIGRWVLLGVSVALGLGLAATYNQRRQVARQAVSAWLLSQGLESQVAFGALDSKGLSSTLRIGPQAKPDLIVERLDLQYSLPWPGRPARVSRVRLLHPQLAARWSDGKLSLGSLDPVIERLLKQPRDPKMKPPEVIIEGGTLRLATPYGPVAAEVDGRSRDGKLDRLDLKLEPTGIKGADFRVQGLGMRLTLVRHADRLTLRADSQIAEGQGGPAIARDVVLHLAGDMPYPDLTRGRIDGPVQMKLTAQSTALTADGVRAEALVQSLNLQGQVSGLFSRVTLNGRSDQTLSIRRMQSGALRAAGVRAKVNSEDLAWSAAAPGRFQTSLNLTAEADTVSPDSSLSLSAVRGAFRGSGGWAEEGLTLNLLGSTTARGGWNGLGPARPDDKPADASLKRALAAFSLKAPGVAIAVKDGQLSVSLPQTVRALPDSGGIAELRTLKGPLYTQGTGAFGLTTSGGGLPTTDLTVAQYRLDGRGLSAPIRLKARGGFGPLVDGSGEIAGDIMASNAGMSFRLARCAPVTAVRFDLDANDLKGLSAQICPNREPFVFLAKDGWRLNAKVKGLGVEVPFAEAAVSEATGQVEANGQGQSLALTATLASGRLTDLAKAQRFRPLSASGTAGLAANLWRGDFALSDLAGHGLAQAKLHHDMTAGVGGVTLGTGLLTFSEGGLQPANLSPLASVIGSPARGQAEFAGVINWNPKGSSSNGELTVKSLDFKSPAGLITGLSGKVVLTSLAPLLAAPGQTLHADSVASLTALTNAQLTFGLDDKAISVGGGSFDLSGGTVTVQPFSIPLDPGAAWHAVIDLEGVQLSDLVEASPFAEQLDLTAKVSGHVPFSVSPSGVQITQGELHAIGPGRISIKREGLGQVAGGVSAPSSPSASQDDPYSDFVYQAMDNLAFDTLNAKLTSLPEGRLGVLFHIKGEHSPPTRTSPDIRLSWREVVGRKITQKVPLPSGTKVDLTLDTSVNLDQLLDDFAKYQGLRGSAAVQPN